MTTPGIDEVLKAIRDMDERLTGRLDGIDGRLDKIDTDIGVLKGHAIIDLTIKDAQAIALGMDLGMDVWHIGALDYQEKTDLMSMPGAAGYSADEKRSFREADLIIRAFDEDDNFCYIAVEASFTIGDDDIRRVVRNAKWLDELAEETAYPVVSGVQIGTGIQEKLDAANVCWHKLKNRYQNPQ